MSRGVWLCPRRPPTVTRAKGEEQFLFLRLLQVGRTTDKRGQWLLVPSSPFSEVDHVDSASSPGGIRFGQQSSLKIGVGTGQPEGQIWSSPGLVKVY